MTKIQNPAIWLLPCLLALPAYAQNLEESTVRPIKSDRRSIKQSIEKRTNEVLGRLNRNAALECLPKPGVLLLHAQLQYDAIPNIENFQKAVASDREID
jgi:hypothetical protein